MAKGAKGKYHDWLQPDGLLLLEGWARDGLTDKDIAENVGVAERTFAEWKVRFDAISTALKKGRGPCDFIVENALYKRAVGYEWEEKTTEVDSLGRKHVRVVTRHVPPDVGAAIFWLKNRRRGKWRDKPLPDDTGEKIDDGFMKALQASAAEDWKDG